MLTMRNVKEDVDDALEVVIRVSQAFDDSITIDLPYVIKSKTVHRTDVDYYSIRRLPEWLYLKLQ